SAAGNQSPAGRCGSLPPPRHGHNPGGQLAHRRRRHLHQRPGRLLTRPQAQEPQIPAADAALGPYGSGLTAASLPAPAKPTRLKFGRVDIASDTPEALFCAFCPALQPTRAGLELPPAWCTALSTPAMKLVGLVAR